MSLSRRRLRWRFYRRGRAGRLAFARLLFEIDSYDISDPEVVILPDGGRATPKHREQLTTCSINGESRSAYIPMFVIGTQPRFGL